ncbi:hypothetical protein [Pontibacter liquoris]|uniref:hypothetical protein n=1 Tax=Pontibacter liquoris TaxID=2905677 RepID=UPI001FA75FC3|nr:hypothetical protein [Pontibacter liquoris]
MVHPYKINALNGLLLILLGLVSYFVVADQPATALLPSAFGLLLLAGTYQLRKHNRFVFHTITSLTLLAGILLLLQTRSGSPEWTSYEILLLLMGVSCFLAAACFIGTFVQERRLRDNSIYKDDL